MRHRLTIVPAALLLVLALGAPVLAKVDVQVRLDAPIPADAAPGSTLVVGWTTTQSNGEGWTTAFSGAPVFIALTPPGATQAEALAFGDEYPTGSGHWTASIVVPSGGIAPDGVSIGLRGESCEAGVCRHADMLFELVGEVLRPAAAVATVAPAVAATAVPVVSVSGVASDPVVIPVAMLALALGFGVAVIGLLALRRRRERPLATD